MPHGYPIVDWNKIINQTGGEYYPVLIAHREEIDSDKSRKPITNTTMTANSVAGNRVVITEWTPEIALSPDLPDTLLVSGTQLANIDMWINLLYRTRYNFGEGALFSTNEPSTQHFDYSVFDNVLTRVAKLYTAEYDPINWNRKWMTEVLTVNDAVNEEIKYLSAVNTHHRDVPANQDGVFAQKVFIDDSNADVAILGDIHSSLRSLSMVMEKIRDWFDGDTLVLQPTKYIIFLGDIVDYGPFGLEGLLFAFSLKLANPDHVWIINGNHEDYSTYYNRQLAAEFGYQLKNTGDTELANSRLRYTLRYLPSIIFLNFNGDWYHLSHGAFDPYYAGTIDAEFGQIPEATRPERGETLMGRFIDSEKSFDMITGKEGYMQTFYFPMRTVQWGDFFQSDELDYYSPADINDATRPKFPPRHTKSYLRYQNLKMVIGGHQDLYDFRVQVDRTVARPYGDAFEEGDDDEPRCDGDDNCVWINGYLYRPHDDPERYNLYRPDAPNGIDEPVYIRPRVGEVLAVATSMASQTKEVHSTYLTLRMLESE